MTGPAAPPDPNFDPALANSAINQLTSASLSGYGQLPNPQAVVEGIRTGSTATLSSALQEGNPLFQSLLAGSPAGGTSAYGSPYGRPPTAIADPTDNIWKFDANTHQQQLHDLLGKDENASWRSFGDAPMLNLGWMQSVRTGSADTVRKWQDILFKRGFYQPGEKHDASGVWDPATEAAFQGFMVVRAVPQALFATDPKAKGDASMFLNGMGYDVSTMNVRDPSRLAQVAQQWMAAQGPDVGQNQKHELQQYADQFGDSALPQSYQAIIQGGFFQDISDMFASLPVVGDIPLVGGVLHSAENLLTMNPDWANLSEDPRKVRADRISQQMKDMDKLTPDDIKNLAPALQQVKDDAGFLGFMDDYDHGRTKFLLASIYTLGDLVTGKFDGHRDNPFDAMSGVNLTAMAHQDSLFAGLFGDQAAQDNPAWAGLFNFAANVVDDPTSYIPLLGWSKALQKSRGVKTASRIIGNEAASTSFANLLGRTIKDQVNDGHFKVARAMVAQGNHWGDADVAHLFQISGVGGAQENDALRLARRIVDPATSEDEARRLYLKGDDTHPGFGWRINTGHTLYNAQAAMKSLAATRSTGRIGRLRAVGAFEELPEHDLLANVAGSATFFRNRAIAIGLEPQDLRQELDAYTEAALNDPNKVGAAVEAIDAKTFGLYFERNGFKEEDLRAFHARRRAGRTLGGGTGAIEDARVNLYAPDQITRAETSLVVKESGDPTAVRRAQAMVRQLNADIATATEQGVPDEMLTKMKQDLADLQRPAPRSPTDLLNAYHSPYSIFELVAYKHPALRHSEELQSLIHADAVLNTWKRITIGRISSGFRIDVGDDIIRPTLQLIGKGNFYGAMSYFTQSVLAAAGLLVPGVRGKVLASLDKMLQEHPEIQGLLQKMHKAIGEGDTDIWKDRVATDPGYQAGLEDMIRWHFSQDPLDQVWLHGFQKGGADQARKDLEFMVRTALETDPKIGYYPEVRAWAQARKADASEQALQDLLDGFHDYNSTYFRNDVIREMATTGKINRTKLRTLIREQGNRIDSTLPVVRMRADSPFARSTVQRWATKGPDAVFEHFTKPALNVARGRGFIVMKNQFERQIREHFRDDPNRVGDEFEKMVHNESSSRAFDWMTNNTYQGTRSVMGGALRTVFPFYGATANMDRFYLRQAAAVPWVGSTIMHTALKSQQSQSAGNQASPGLTGFEGILAHLGFGGGEGIKFNPGHAFFLTSDGIGSMVPGTGPIFAPLWRVVSGNTTLATILADLIPGAKTEIDYATGQARPLFPYLADLLSGTSLALTGGAPDLGPLGVSQDTINRMVDSKVPQRERELGRALNPGELDSLRREVGRDLMLQSAASFTIPASPLVTDVQAQRTAQSMDQWRQQTTEAGKDAVIAQALGIKPEQWSAAVSGAQGSPTVADLISAKPDSDAALMAYMDHRVSAEDRDAIAGAAPWVASAATSKYQSTAAVPGEPTTAVDLAQWKMMRQHGDITLLTPEQYTAKIADERDINVGWQKYDDLKTWEYETLQANGWSTTSPAFKAWKAAQFDPQVIRELQNPHPAWWRQFGSAAGGGKTSIDLAGKTRSLRTLQTWEVIPQHSDYENTQSVLWRNALLLRDQAAQQIYSIRAAHGGRAETDMVMMALQQQLQQLAAQDPNFAAQLGTFRFGNWMDVVDLEANDLATQNYAGPRLT